MIPRSPAGASAISAAPRPDPLDGDRLILYRLMHDAFLDAAGRAGGARHHDYRIGDSVVRLSFAGESLTPRVARALAHLAVPSQEHTDLVICVWDSASTGRPLPLLASSLVRLLRMTGAEHRGTRGEILEYCSDRAYAALHGHDSTMLSLLDFDACQGMLWVPDDEGIPWYESGAPLRALLSWWFGRRRQQMVHAGAIGTDAGGLLLGGRASSGKSTTALASLAAPLLYAGDDYVLVAPDPEPMVYSLYNTAKVKGEVDLKRFPWMASRICNAGRLGPDAEKPMMFLHEHQPEKIIRGFPLKAVVLPRYMPDNKTSKVIAISPMSAFKAIAHSTITQLTGAHGEALQALSRLVHRVPCYLVGLGQTLDDIPDVMLELLARS